jgi:hypothetical protein
LQNFGSSSDGSFANEDEDDDGEFSDSDSETRTKERGKLTKIPKKRAGPIDFSKLPTLDNNGLHYLPVMHYFEVSSDCPLKTANKLPPEQSLTVIIQLPNGSFNCVAIPLDAVHEDEHE